MTFLVNGRVVQESTHKTNKREAQGVLRDRLREIDAGTYSGPKSQQVTVADLAEGLFRDYRINGKRTLRDVQTRWTLHLAPFFGAMRANEVKREDIKKYVDQRLLEGASNASVNRELSALKRMYRLALGDTVLRMPVFPHLQERNIRKGFVQDNEYAKLAAACSREGLWMRAMFETAYRIGCA